MAKPKRPTTKDSVLLKKGQSYTREELKDITSKMVGSVYDPEKVNSIKDVVSYLNNKLIDSNTKSYVGITRSDLGVDYSWVARDLNKSDLFDVKYDKSLGGYILSKSKAMSDDYDYSDAVYNLSYYSGYSVQSVTKNGITYDNVIVKRDKNVRPARYKVAKK